MHRLLPALLLFLAACGGGSERHSELPFVPDHIVEFAPPDGERTERFAATGLDDLYHLSRLPYSATLETWVVQDGWTIVLGPGDFHYEAVPNAVVFDGFVPDQGAEVVVTYLELSR